MLNDFISLIFPRYCMACKNGLARDEEILCMQCTYDLPKTLSHKDPDNYIARKFYGKIPIHEALACYKFTKNGRVQEVLHQLKYNNKPDLGVWLGENYGRELISDGWTPIYDMIVPVPLHQSKYRLRGYNQSLKFATGLGNVLDLKVEDILGRTTKTSTQTNKSRLDRWQNVDDVFEVKSKESLITKKILLVDDVITTGATLESCAIQLKNFGCEQIGIMAIAAAQ